MTQRRGFDLGDYVEVHERIAAFKAAHPEGSLQAEIYLLNESVVVMKGYAYRTPDDPRPGIGWSSLAIPGSTPYTRGSEIENCETSCWGRAIAALGFEVKRGIASREEVDNKRPDPDDGYEEARRTATRGRYETNLGDSTPKQAPAASVVDWYALNAALREEGVRGGNGPLADYLYQPSVVGPFGNLTLAVEAWMAKFPGLNFGTLAKEVAQHARSKEAAGAQA